METREEAPSEKGQIVYLAEVKPKALKELQALPVAAQVMAVELIDALESDPRPRGCKKLFGPKDRWRIRFGDYHILYEIDDDEKVVTIFRVLHRKEAYR